nr:uncharacterized protein LOC113800809 [Penaeus vannamei]
MQASLFSKQNKVICVSDGADEVGCDRSPCDGFRCWDEVCIPGPWHCDGHEDCRDGEDEYGCPVCSQEALKCPSGGGCVSVDLTCDGVEDCPDGWDESGEVCKKDQCGPDEVPCWMGQCVEHRQLCDGVADCPTSEDEDSSFCLAFRSMRVAAPPPPTSAQPSTTPCTPAEVREVNCTQEEFRCASGECVLRTTLCDGKRDCWTADDEEFPICNFIFNVDVAKERVEAKGDGRKCDEATMTLCPSGRCVPLGEACDRENDCEENDPDRGVTCVNSHEAVTTVASGAREKTVTDDIDNEIENDLTIDVPPTTGIISQDSRDHLYKPNDVEDVDEAAGVKNITSSTANNEISGAAENEIAGGGNALEGEAKENDLNLASLEDDDAFDGVEVSVDVLVEGSTLPEGMDASFDVTTTGDFDDDADMEASGDDEFTDDVIVTVSPPSVTPTVLEVTTTQKTALTEHERRINELAYNDTDINSILDYSEEDEENHKSTSYSSSMESDESSETEKTTFEIGGIGSNMSIENSSFISSKSSLSSLESGESEFDGELLNQTTKSVSMLDAASATTTASAEASAAESNITVIEYDISSEDKISTSNTSLNSNQDTLDDASTNDKTTTEASETTATLQETAETTAGSLPSPNTTSDEEDLGSGEAESYGEFDSVNKTTSTSPPDTSETRHPESTPASQTAASTEQDESTSKITSSSDAETHTSSSTVEFSTLSPTVELPTLGSTAQSSPSSSTPEATTTTTSTVTTFATDMTSWKDQQTDQQNLTVLIAIHSEMNRSRIPQYVIHGLDGNTYEYEVVTVVKDEELARKVQLTATRRPPEGKDIHASSKEPGMLEDDSDGEDPEADTKVTNGTHEISYLQHNDISSASSVSSSLASLATVVLLLRTLLPAG